MRFFSLLVLLLYSSVLLAAQSINIPILVYHNLNPTVRGSMNLTPKKFESQIKWLKDNGFNFISLKEAIAYLEGKQSSLPSKSIVITADDGWKSNYLYLLPIVKQFKIPVTLFIYPGTISEGKHALTWDELKAMQQTGLFDIESHTFSHPNFKHEKKRLSFASYEKFVHHELADAKKILEDKLNTKIIYLAWPFGIYDDYLEAKAKEAGYEMAFSIDAQYANRNKRAMAQPRFMIIDAQSMKNFAAIAKGASIKPK